MFMKGSSVVLGTEKDPVTMNDPLGTIPTNKWKNTIIKCYERFCSPQARAKAAKESSPKLHNLLIRLHEFSTVIEANNATKAGDVGRLMNVWKTWCVMCQGLKGLMLGFQLKEKDAMEGGQS
jgi:hypothetical protein